MQIRSIYITPSFAVARLGSSTTPVECYQWADVQEPRYDGETTVVPDWSLAIDPDGSIRPYLPLAIEFRDGARIRPVAPFFEVWARVGDAPDPQSWTDMPLTAALLGEAGRTLADVELEVSAFNRKAAFRMNNPDLVFGTFPAVAVAADDNDRVALSGVSPPSAATPMIPPGRSIPLGSLQWLRSRPQPLNEAWSDAVDVEVLRFRFWPPAGSFYGPPEAALAAPLLGRPQAAVPAGNAFLDPAAGWFNGATGDNVLPGDTYDVIDQINSPTGASLGVVDDTCEVHFDLTLNLGGSSLTTRAVAFVAPPDFAPDRRPFLSVADELNDRSADAVARNAAMDDEELDLWIEDLFERVYETASLLNVDLLSVHPRRNRAAQLPASEQRPNDLDAGVRPRSDFAMGGRDAHRNPLYQIDVAAAGRPLPLSEHARMRHRALSDLQNLVSLLATNPNRFLELIRGPFEVESFEDYGATTMRMPPFMRQSNALPLTLAQWQYDLIIRWTERVRMRSISLGAPLDFPMGGPRNVLSDQAQRRRDTVLRRLEAEEQR